MNSSPTSQLERCQRGPAWSLYSGYLLTYRDKLPIVTRALEQMLEQLCDLFRFAHH